MKDEIGEYIIEFCQIGVSTKVTAICVKTHLEVSIIVPSSFGQHQAKLNAIKKLEYVKAKKQF